MHNAMARAQVLKSFTLKSHQKQLMLVRGEERKNKEELNKMELQDQDLLGSPHLVERWIGGIVDLDLLSLFPQRYARTMGKIESGASFPRSTMVGEREKNVLLKSLVSLGKKGPFIGPPKNRAVAGILHRRLRTFSGDTPDRVQYVTPSKT